MSTRRLGKGMLVIGSLVALALTGCTPSASDSSSPAVPTSSAPTAAGFSLSQGIDDNGFLVGIRALDFFDDLVYEGVVIPADVMTVSDEAVQAEIEILLADYQSSIEITDRPVQQGDTVNIDYVGSVDGVAFEGGSTEGAGTDVVIGQTQYVDDFIDQLIGHNTNDSFDITVTFPDDYHQTELRGKDAVFAITINAISVTGLPQITDDFVAQNLAANYGWTTVAEMNETVQAGLSRDSRLTFVRDYLLNQIPVKDIPDSVMEYQKQSMLSYYQSQADSYGLALNDYVSQALGLADVDELVQEAETDLRNAAIYSLASQAVAEAAAITVSEQEVSDYFLETTGSEDYSLYAEQDGMPYLKQVVLWNKVVALIIDLAVSE